MTTYEFDKLRPITHIDIDNWKFRAFNTGKKTKTEFYSLDKLVAKLEKLIPLEDTPYFISAKTEKGISIAGQRANQYSPATDDDLVEITQKYLTLTYRRAAKRLLKDIFGK